jgi:hypothetical protein
MAEFTIVTRSSSSAWIPELIAAAGAQVTETSIDFFTSTIRNGNTRAAYARACWQFFDWCGTHNLELKTVRPFQVAAWIEDFPGSKTRCGADAVRFSGARLLPLERLDTTTASTLPSSTCIWSMNTLRKVEAQSRVDSKS